MKIKKWKTQKAALQKENLNLKIIKTVNKEQLKIWYLRKKKLNLTI